MQYRYTVTFDAIEGCFTGETRDRLKKRLTEDTQLLCGENVKVTVEDQFCIDINKDMNVAIATVENMMVPESGSNELRYAKMLMQFLKSVQDLDGNKNSNFNLAMIAAINALMNKGLESNENLDEKEQGVEV